MSNFATVRASVSPEGREVLDFVWEHYLKTEKWPLARQFLGKFPKDRFGAIVAGLGDWLLFRAQLSDVTFQLGILGVLCTSKGDEYIDLLKRYLAYARDIFYQHHEVTSIRSDSMQAQLKLTPEQTRMIGRLIFGGFLHAGGSYSEKFESWESRLPAELEDMPSSGDLTEAFNRVLDQLAESRTTQSAPVARPNATPELPTSPPEAGPPAPDVFISYSHDSKEHKMWVLELAQALHHAGLNVMFDQWDMGLGTDVPKFMEQAVTRAGRVLMICSEAYVRKVDEGKGGAGYEGMIVTGELVRNLGTDKFIPVIRQKERGNAVPKCVGTRLWVNLSVGSDFDAEFARLVAELKREPPATKPKARGVAAPQAVSGEPENGLAVGAGHKGASIVPQKFSTEPSEAYSQALTLARGGDLVAWRRLVTGVKTEAVKALTEWRNKPSAMPQKTSELHDFVRPAVASHQALFAVALAGIESGQPKFNSQAGLIYDLLTPKDWNPGGLTLQADMPEALGFLFQALSGAMAVHSGQISVAMDLAALRVPDRRNSSKSGPLFQSHELVGWPRPFDADCSISWSFLLRVPEMFPWVREAFGSADAYVESLCGYYALLSWLEFLFALKTGVPVEAGKRLRLDVPPMFLRSEHHVAGIRRLLEDREPILRHALKSGSSVSQQLEKWPVWVGLLWEWLDSIYHEYFNQSDFTHFAEDVHR